MQVKQYFGKRVRARYGNQTPSTKGKIVEGILSDEVDRYANGKYFPIVFTDEGKRIGVEPSSVELAIEHYQACVLCDKINPASKYTINSSGHLEHVDCIRRMFATYGPGWREAPCKIPPRGWECSRNVGHPGPCVARPVGILARISKIFG